MFIPIVIARFNNNTTIYCDTKEDEKAFKNTNNLLEVLGYSETVRKIKHVFFDSYKNFFRSKKEFN